MTLLASRLDIGNLVDVEAVCSSIVRRQLAAGGGYLEPHDRDDAITYLIGEAWILYGRFDETRGATFRTYATPILQRRIVDWYRARLGRSSNAPRPQLVSTNDVADAELERALTRGPGDNCATRAADEHLRADATGGRARRRLERPRGAS